MARFMLALLSAVVFCGVSVSGKCDSLTKQRVQECFLHSHIMDPNLSPRDEFGLKLFCKHEENRILGCIRTHVQECIHNAKENHLMSLLINMDGFRLGFDNLCSNITYIVKKPACLDIFKSPGYLECAKDDLLSLRNSLLGVTDLKTRLDRLCSFFYTLETCLVDPFRGYCEGIGRMYLNYLKSLKYPYCKLSNEARVAAIEEYNAMPQGPVYHHYPKVEIRNHYYKESSAMAARFALSFFILTFIAVFIK